MAHPKSSVLTKKYVHLGALLILVCLLLLNWQSEIAPEATALVHSGQEKNSPDTAVVAPGHAVAGLSTNPEATVPEKRLRIMASMESGHPIALISDATPSFGWQISFRPRTLFANGFRTSLGVSGDAMDVDTRSYEGRIIGEDGSLEAGTATAVVMGNAIAMVIREDDGALHYVRTHPVTGELETRVQEAGELELACVRQNQSEFAIETENGLPFASESLWANARSAQLQPLEANLDIAAFTGIDPVTGQLDKYVNRIPEAPQYAASLKDALLLLALDKSATGPNNSDSLASAASIYLATVSNVAAAYENQLGVRLLVSELIMTPDSKEFADLPATENLSDFRAWVSQNRRQSSYGWTLASKFGSGLRDRVLGVAYVSSLSTTNAVSMCDTAGIWDVLAHEMGHNFGSEHSSGGIMNASSLGGSVRTFFTDVQAGETSAEAIHRYAASRLAGTTLMRDPEQIPFASNDSVSTEINTPVLISPLTNDATSVRNGAENTVTLEEVGSVSPFSAGTLEILENDIRFTPADGYQGPAWFSYSIRGNIGNNGNGWLHKADIGVSVGTSPSLLQITMAPGGSYSFQQSLTTSIQSIEQPAQARVDVSRDNSRLIIIRASKDATGTDTFRIGSGNSIYTITYDDNLLRTQPDSYVLDPRAERFEFFPLINDEGAGERWLQDIRPVLGVGNAGVDTTGQELFGTTFRLISAQLLTLDLGSIFLPTHQVVINGRRTSVNKGSIVFFPIEGATGTARLEYRVQDAAGRQTTETVEIAILPSRNELFVAADSAAAISIPADDGVDQVWMQPDFDDSTWSGERAGIGYERSSGFEDFFLTDIEDTMFSRSTSAYLRIPFTVDDALKFKLLTLRMRYDDGFIAYLNGTEIARANAPDGTRLPWNTTSPSSRVESQATEFAAFDLTSQRSLLTNGENILAIHGMNQSIDSSDFLISPELEGSIIGEGAEIVFPIFADVAIDEGTGLLASGRIFAGTDQEGLQGQWQVTQSPQGAETTVSDGQDVAIEFSAVGEYELTFAAVGAPAGFQSEDTLRVTVGNASEDIPRGASISIRQSADTTSGLAAQFTASVGNTARTLEWKKIAGPGEAFFSQPDSAFTDVIVTEPGDYIIRLTADTEQIQTFRDISWTATPVLSTLISPVTTITESGATLAGHIAGASPDSVTTFYLGTNDGGENPAAWETSELGIVEASGRVQAEVEGLLSESTYFFRIAIEDEGDVIWSEVQSFTTLPFDPINEILLTENSPGTVFVPDSAATAQSASIWGQKDFDDSSWFPGRTGFGYDTSGTFSDFVVTDIADLVFEKNTTLYVRVPFGASSIDRDTIEKLTLRIRYDDAFIAYLNGAEITRSDNAPNGEPAWNAVAPERRDNALAVQFAEFDMTQGSQHLVEGENLLAILAVNLQLDSRDLLISPEIVASRRTDTYSRWVEDFGVRESDLDQDPDGDGITNLYEFAFGLHPGTPDQSSSVFPAIDVSSSNQVSVGFQRRRDAEAAGISYSLEQSEDLSQWSALDLAEAAPAPVASGPSITERVSVNLTSAQARYLRLRVTLER